MRGRLTATLLLLVLSGAEGLIQALALERGTAVAASAQAEHLVGVVPPCHHAAVNPGVEFAAPAMPPNSPCDDQDSCCMRRAPANAPGLPSANGLRRIAVREAQVPNLSKEIERRAWVRTVHEKNLSPYEVFSTVLRI